MLNKLNVIFLKIFKWINFPLCFILFCIKRMKKVFTKDIPWFYDYGMYDIQSIKELYRISIHEFNDYNQDVSCYYLDKPEVMRDILFKMLEDFVENEKCFEYNCYEEDEYFTPQENEKNIRLGKEIKKLYNIIKLLKYHPEDLEKIAKLLYTIDANYFFAIIKNTPKNLAKEYNLDYSYFIMDLEETLTQKVCERIVKIRKNLWV